MSTLISRIGRNSLRTRSLYALIYFVLILGSVTMLYPFLLMISGSTKSAVDIRDFDIVPRFFYDDTCLYRKHIEGLFNESIASMKLAYDSDINNFQQIKPPANYNFLLVEEFRDFLDKTELPWYSSVCGYMDTPVSKTMPINLRKFKRYLKDSIGDIVTINRAMGTEFQGWAQIRIRTRQYLLRHEKPSETLFTKTQSDFTGKIHSDLKFYLSPIGLFKRTHLGARYGDSIAEYNMAHKTDYTTIDDIYLPRSYPNTSGDKEKEDWESFVRYTLGAQWISADKTAEPAYHAFLKAKYQTTAALNQYYGTGYKQFEDIKIDNRNNFGGPAAADWDLFISGWKAPDNVNIYAAPIGALRIDCTDFLFQDFLQRKFRNIEKINSRFGTAYKDFKDIQMPQSHLHYAYFLRNRLMLRMEFATRNYISVLEYIALHGRGVLNTAIYCILAVLCALIVNPLAAYALSRFRLPSAYKILLFLLCTMAFPPMVTSIPNFLILRKIGLLNTFAALVLPAMANGYSIFLLKGFFDSQPRELYESAQLDGAGEWTLFWQIAMSLSKPILAVIALQAFTMAYSNFMFAFIVCQDEKMWTLMVWLYQLHLHSGQAVMYASLIIAAVPTFLIFIFCQKIIMRGIVIPSEK